jgi:GH15 family glucan-1,4-alpha-glucosidase
MPRDIPVGNGKLLVCFDQNYSVRDLYFPHVGQENHIGGRHSRMGVWVENEFSWVGPEWKRDLRYLPDTLVTQVSLHHEKLGLLLKCRDIVDYQENIYLREISVENTVSRPREIRLFFNQDFNISGNDVGDTAVFDPVNEAIVHYKGSRYFLVNGCIKGRKGLFQFAVGQKGIGGKEGTFRDAEDGFLSGNPIAQGSVDSVIALRLQTNGEARGYAYYWIAAGQTWNEVRTLNALVQSEGPQNLIHRTHDYWLLWSRKETPPLEELPADIGRLYRRSLLVVTTQIDWKGGITAANDSDIIHFARDTYSYVWPRDGALAANAMDLAGYGVFARNFYQFAAEVIEEEGYFLHKYNPDGTLASSWHPWFQGGKSQLPIQEDETALVIWALWNHFVLYRDIEFIRLLYKPLIKKAADFMCRYRDPETGLPGESYDLWEEQRGIFSFTVGAVFGGLTAASLFCTVFGDEEGANCCKQSAAEIRDAASTYLWRHDLNRFCRRVWRDDRGVINVDGTCDASLWGLFAFGLYSADDPRIISTFDALREKLWVKTGVGGMARYENDSYQKTNAAVPGNPWFICTLWLANYLTERARTEEELKQPLEILKWVSDHALPSGVLAEQIHPISGGPISVSPLTWSHSTFVASVQHLLHQLSKLKICESCGSSLLGRSRNEGWLEQLLPQACDSIYGMCEVK